MMKVMMMVLACVLHAKKNMMMMDRFGLAAGVFQDLGFRIQF